MDEKPTARGDGGQSPSAERLLQRSRHLRDEAGGLARAASEALDELEAVLREQLTRRPYAVLGGAAAAGYVLGGGLPSFVTRRVAELGARIAVAALIQNAVGRAASKGEM